MKSVQIPETVETIGERAFMGLHWLNNVYANAMIPSEAPENTFTETAYKNAVLHVPAGTIERYKSHPTLSKFLNIVQNDNIDTAVEDVDSETSAAEEIFTLSGIKMGDRDSLAPGIYVVRQGGKTQKIAIK